MTFNQPASHLELGAESETVVNSGDIFNISADTSGATIRPVTFVARRRWTAENVAGILS